MKPTRSQADKQTPMVAGVCVPIDDGAGDYDELLREALRVALRIDTDPRTTIFTISTPAFVS